MKILTIAWNTFRESIRDRILYNLLIFSLLLIGGTVFIQDLTVSTQRRVMLDLGLASISIFGTMMAIFLGIGLVYKEIDRRTIFTIASKPISRASFIVGKFIGQLITLVVNLSIMTFVLMVAFRFVFGEFNWTPLPTVLFLFLELMVLTSIAMLFSSFSTPTLSAIFTLSIWLMGHLVADMRSFAAHSKRTIFSDWLVPLTHVIPDLERFNLKNWATYGDPIAPETYMLSIALGLLYTAFFLGGAMIIFENRDFK